ncbi:MAG: hypothetical protein PHH06_02720 [Candidatus Gracilibacteria bacterium]|nr:hypothetical protein [Candidatus Gracilibacteria bacterium]
MLRYLNKEKYLIITILLLIYSSIITIIFLDKNTIKEIKNIEIIDRNYFSDNIILNDYSSAKFKLKEEGINIIKSIRNLHNIKNLIGSESKGKEVCAGYIWELSKILWGDESPYHIGMMNQETKVPAKAWELPYYYEFFGGKIMIDFSNDFSLKEKNYREKIDIDKLKIFFGNAFTEKSLLGDIGFLYKDTQYANFLDGRSSNSHITKNMGISKFEIILKSEQDLGNHLGLIGDNLGCDKEVFSKINNLLSYYKIYLNGKQIILKDNYFYYLENGNQLGDKVQFKYLDKIIYEDIIVTHFFESISRVDSLFQMTCKGDFLPINIISINSRFIEKK